MTMGEGWKRVGIFFIILLVLFGAWFLYQKRTKSGTVDVPGVNIFENSEGNGSGTALGIPLSEEEAISREVKEDLSQKFNTAKDQISVSVESYTGSHARGTVNVSDGSMIAWWLAAKDKGGWMVVTSGNGEVMCREIEGYDFPTEMVPTCFDNFTQRIRGR